MQNDKTIKAKQLLQEWVDQQGHDRCWYYPEIFEKLVELFEVKASVPVSLPPLSQFKQGCERYQQKEYNSYSG